MWARQPELAVAPTRTTPSCLGVFADDPAYVAAVRIRPEESIPASVRRISQELGINLIQLYTPERKLAYLDPGGGQHAVGAGADRGRASKVVRRQKSMLAAVGITLIPRQGTLSHYLVLGSLSGRTLLTSSQLTGLKTRLYYREGNYYDLFFLNPDDAVVLKHLSATVLARIDKDKNPYYSSSAESGKFRGL